MTPASPDPPPPAALSTPPGPPPPAAPGPSPAGSPLPPFPPAPSPAPSPAARRISHPARWIAGGLAVVLVVLAVVAATRPTYQATQADSPLVGRPAPAFTAVSFTGQTLSLASYRGHYLFVNFFASWCPPCQAEEPNLVRFAFEQQQTSDGADLLSVVFSDTNAAARQFVTQWGAQWPTIPDHGGAIANSFGVTSPPTTFLINPAGIVVGDLVGPVKVAQLTSMLAEARRATP